MGEFPYRFPPYKVQRDCLRISALRKSFGVFLEQGLGKTKVTIDNAAYLFMEGNIDGLLIVAPNGVHTNWLTDELPKHMPDPVEWKGMEWISSKAENKAFIADYLSTLNFEGLSVFTVNVEALSTPKAKKAVKTFLQKRRCMLVVDESTDIKRSSSQRSRFLFSVRALARYRRILTGTPAGDGSPFDYFGQFKFLDPAILGSSMTAFKNEYAEMIPAPWTNAPPHLKVVKKYRNLDRLHKIISAHSFRMTKDELKARGELDIPDKSFTKWYVDLTPAQRRMYEELKEDFITQMEDSNDHVVAALTITRYLRLQQIVQGYVPVESDEDPQPIQIIPGPNNRLDALGEWLDQLGGRKFIIWSRFHIDHDLIMERFGKKHKMVRYDGTVPKGKRDENKLRFLQDPDCLGFLGNQKAGGRGLTLNISHNTAFYSNYFDLEWRLQAEDRNHRIGQVNKVLYTDFVAKGTIDVKVLAALRKKKSVADTITG